MRISDWSSDVCSSDLDLGWSQYEAVPAWLTPRWAAAFTSSNVSTKHVGEAVFALMVTTHQCEQSRSSDPPRGTGARFDSAFAWIVSTSASSSLAAYSSAPRAFLTVGIPSHPRRDSSPA